MSVILGPFKVSVFLIFKEAKNVTTKIEIPDHGINRVATQVGENSEIYQTRKFFL